MRVVLNWHRVQDGSGLTRAGISDPTNGGIYRGDGIHDPEDGKALDNNELALARNLRTKLSAGKHVEHGQKNVTKKSG